MKNILWLLAILILSFETALNVHAGTVSEYSVDQTCDTDDDRVYSTGGLHDSKVDPRDHQIRHVSRNVHSHHLFGSDSDLLSQRSPEFLNGVRVLQLTIATRSCKSEISRLYLFFQVFRI